MTKEEFIEKYGLTKLDDSEEYSMVIRVGTLIPSKALNHRNMIYMYKLARKIYTSVNNNLSIMLDDWESVINNE